MTPTTALPLTVVFMIIAGLGIGPFFSVLTIAAQNALPRERMGIGTSALRYLGQLGAVLGVAVVGTVVNNTLDNDITKRLPANAAQQLTPAGVKAATNPQVLTNQDYRNTLVNTAKHYAAQGASAHVPPGPQHDQIAAAAAAQAMQQAQHMLDQVFAALRLSLAVAIQHGLVAILIISSTLLVLTFFLKDLPLVQRRDRKPANAETSSESNFSPIP
jgi:mannose/fructose/N-acetylgalactosamine-specific phosphotransferase system component IID